MSRMCSICEWKGRMIFLCHVMPCHFDGRFQYFSTDLLFDLSWWLWHKCAAFKCKINCRRSEHFSCRFLCHIFDRFLQDQIFKNDITQDWSDFITHYLNSTKTIFALKWVYSGIHWIFSRSATAIDIYCM